MKFTVVICCILAGGHLFSTEIKPNYESDASLDLQKNSANSRLVRIQLINNDNSTYTLSGIREQEESQGAGPGGKIAVSNIQYTIPETPSGPHGYSALLNLRGELVWPFQENWIFPFSEGKASIQNMENQLFGVIDLEGKLIIPYSYEIICSFRNGFAPVRKNNLFGGISEKGEEIIPCRYHFVEYFSEDFAVVSRMRKYGYVNRSGQEVIALQYDWAESFSDGLAVVAKEGKYGFINSRNEPVIPLELDHASSFRDGVAIVKKDGQWQILRKADWSYTLLGGDPVYESQGGLSLNDMWQGQFRPEKVYYFSEGLALIQKDQRYGYVDTTGKIIVAPQYSLAGNFHCGLARVRDENGVWHYLNRQGEIAFSCSYTFVADFHEDRAWVTDGQKYGCINTSGNLVIALLFDDFFVYENGYALVKIPEGSFYVDINGVPVSPCLPYEFLCFLPEENDLVIRVGIENE